MGNKDLKKAAKKELPEVKGIPIKKIMQKNRDL